MPTATTCYLDRDGLWKVIDSNCSSRKQYLIYQLGAPLIQYDYVPVSKIYFYSVSSKDELPVFLVAYNSLKLLIDASRYPESTISKIEGEDMTLNFVYNFVKSMKFL